MRLALVLIMVLTMTGVALAVCPDLDGIWSSVPDASPEYYPILDGRLSEAWCNGMPGEAGNIQNTGSWDGSALGTEWRIWDMTINAGGPVVVYDGVVDGTGVRISQIAYDGGQFWLAGDGLWTDGDVELSGAVADYLIVLTETFVDGVVVGAVSNITFTGTFDDCIDCWLDFASANADLVWRADYTWGMPADYPGFLCGDSGELAAVHDITLGIECSIQATEPRSWSGIKTLYR